jgi:glycosyltransferase involved in cell wall biosynthesis
MSKPPLVTVVTPSFNQGHFIEATIQSVLAQDYPRIEHIVVDGGSVDGTLATLARHDHLRWVSEPDDGQTAALRKGFAMATGTIFAWLNTDDLYLPGAVSAAVAALEETGAGLVHGGWQRIDEAGETISDVRVKKLDLARLLDGTNMVAQPAAFFTREAYEAVGGVDERYHYAMDFDLWIKLAKRFPVAEIDAPLAAFRVHDAAKSSALADEFFPETRRISRRHGGRFFSPTFIEHQFAQHPWLWRARMAYRLAAKAR